MLNVTTAKTSELVAFYNEHNPSKPVKKFADRATAEKRVAALIASLEALAAPSNELEVPEPKREVIEDSRGVPLSVPPVKTHKARAVVKKSEPTQEQIDAMSDEEYEAWVKGDLNAPKGEDAPTSSASRRSNSAGIAASWNDPTVAEKRLTRDGVMVHGVGEFKSVRAAFAALNLPDSKHIRFRMKLKEAKKLEFVFGTAAYTFEIV